VALADWAHARLVEHRPLPPLTPHECGELFDSLQSTIDASTVVADRGEAALRERLLQGASGVPFFVVSYAQALKDGSAGAHAVPWDVAQGIRQRVAALPHSARTLLTAAAVVGREFQPAALKAITEDSEADVVAGLEADCQARLLIDTGRAYQFAHDLVREVAKATLARRDGPRYIGAPPSRSNGSTPETWWSSTRFWRTTGSVASVPLTRVRRRQMSTSVASVSQAPVSARAFKNDATACLYVSARTALA
jgi:hypothetical protein